VGLVAFRRELWGVKWGLIVRLGGSLYGDYPREAGGGKEDVSDRYVKTIWKAMQWKRLVLSF